MPNWKRSIALFLAGQSLTLFGSMLVHYAIMWHITLQTQSGPMMTLITAAGALPMFFIAPFGGAWADRGNKKHIINIADAAIAAVTLGMAVLFSLGADNAALLLVCLAARALGQGVQMPAVNALLPELVPQEQLTRVNGFNGSIQSIIQLASPMAGGALLAIFPIQTLLFIDVVTAVLGIGILLLFVKVPPRAQAPEKAAGAKQYFTEIGEGLRYVGKQTFLKRLLVIASLYNILIAPAAVLSQLHVVRSWGDAVWTVLGLPIGPEQRLASFNIAYFIGMTLGGLAIGAWGGFKNKTRTMALAMAAQGVFAAGMGLFGGFVPYLACVFLCGLFVPVFTAPMISLLQAKIDPAFMGRVFAVLGMMSSLMMPLGMVLWGPLGEAVPIRWILMGSGAVIFLLGFLFILDKSLRKAGDAPLHDATASY